MLYSELDVYRNCVCHIGMYPWWQLARHKPNLTNLVSGVLAVFQGGQPRGMQCSFDGKACKLCDTAQRDNAQHVLFVCPGLDTVRSRTTINAWSSSGGTSQLQYKDKMWNYSIGLKVSIRERMGWNICKCRQIYSWHILQEEKPIRWHWTISFGYHMNELWKRGFASSHYVYTACNVGHIILFLLRVIP